MNVSVVKIAAGLLVLALIAPAMLGAVGYLANAATEEDVSLDQSSQAALQFILKIEAYINKTLSLAAEFNVTIPDEYQANIENSTMLLEQAKEIAGTDPETAVNLAIEAAQEYAPVAMYIYENLPVDYKATIEKKQVELAIEHREKLVQKLQIMLEKMNETGVLTGEEWQKIKAMQQMISQAQIALQEGNITIAMHKVMIVDNMMRTEVHVHMNEHMIKLEVKYGMGSAIEGLIGQLNGIASTINATIVAVNDTRTVDENISLLIESMINRSERLEYKIERILSVIDLNATNQTALEALYMIQASLNQSTTYLYQAYNASLIGDVNATLDNLTQSYLVLNATLTQLEEMNLVPPELRIMIMHEHKVMIEFRHSRTEHTDETWTNLYNELQHKMEKLQNAYEKYQNGHMSKMKYKGLLMVEKGELLMLKQRIEGQAPDYVIQKINEILDWINTHQP